MKIYETTKKLPIDTCQDSHCYKCKKELKEKISFWSDGQLIGDFTDEVANWFSEEGLGYQEMVLGPDCAKSIKGKIHHESYDLHELNEFFI